MLWDAVWSIEKRPLRRNVKRFQAGLVSKAHSLLYHSTLGSRVIKKKKKIRVGENQSRAVEKRVVNKLSRVSSIV